MSSGAIVWRKFADTQTKQLHNLIEEIAESASKPNWDGEEADAVSRATIDAAKGFVTVFPRMGKLPDVSATPQGEVYFEWVIAKDRMLTILVEPEPEHEIIFAALIGDERASGRQPWSGRLPTTLKCWFHNLIE